jgi:hypothetical protein
MNQEILSLLSERYLSPPERRRETEALLQRLLALHERWHGPPLTIAEIQAAIDEGRD